MVLHCNAGEEVAASFHTRESPGDKSPGLSFFRFGGMKVERGKGVMGGDML